MAVFPASRRSRLEDTSCEALRTWGGQSASSSRHSLNHFAGASSGGTPYPHDEGSPWTVYEIVVGAFCLSLLYNSTESQSETMFIEGLTPDGWVHEMPEYLHVCNVRSRSNQPRVVLKAHVVPKSMPTMILEAMLEPLPLTGNAFSFFIAFFFFGGILAGGFKMAIQLRSGVKGLKVLCQGRVLRALVLW